MKEFTLKDFLALLQEGRIDITVRDLVETIGVDAFTHITRDAANVSMMRGFATVPENWRAICSVGSANNMQTQYFARLAEFGVLDEVSEFGPYNDAKATEVGANFTIKKYGKMFGVSLEAQANDAIGELGKTLAKFGSAAARTLDRFVFYTLLDQNPTWTDAVAVFNAAHNNLLTSAGLNTANLDAAVAKLRNQTDANSTKLHLLPRFLIVSPAKRALAQRIVGSMTTSTFGDTAGAAYPIASAGEINPHRGIQVIETAWLTTSTDWYVAADPMQCSMIEMKFFRGQQAPELFTEAPGTGGEFQYDATRYKVRYIFGGGWGDFRGAVKNTA